MKKPMHEYGLRVPTARQQQVIDIFIAEWPHAPTLRELMGHLDIRSTNGVADHLRALRVKGWFQQGDDRLRPAQSRCWALTDRARRYLGLLTYSELRARCTELERANQELESKLRKAAPY